MNFSNKNDKNFFNIFNASICYIKNQTEGNIGYTSDEGNIVLIAISLLGIAINLLFFIISIRKIIISNRKKNVKISSIEKILCAISIIETCISICWLLNSFVISNMRKLKEKCDWCAFIGLFEIFFYIFDWMILVATLIQIKNILIKPLELLKTEKLIGKYIIFGILFSLFNVVFGCLSDVEGPSPMLTCFVRVYGWEYKSEEVYKNIFYVFFFVIPIFILFYGIYLVFIIINLPEFKQSKENKGFIISYLFYVIIYILLALLLISAYIVDYFNGNNDSDSFKTFIQIVTYLSCSTPLIVGTFRLFKANIIKRLLSCKSNKDLLINKNIDYNYEESLNMTSNKKSNKETDYVEFEKGLLCIEFKKIFVGISYVLDKYKHYSEEQNACDNSIYNINSSITDIQTYKINKNEILKDLDLLINEDKFVLEQKEINIKLKVYNAKFFKKMREIDGIKEDQIIRTIQPKNVSANLIRTFKNGSFYINSTNMQYILKIIKPDKISYYNEKIMKNGIDTYLEKNPNSLICRVYGLFQMQIDDKKIYHLALMDNVYEFLENNVSLTKKKKNINEDYEMSRDTMDSSKFNENQNNKIMYCFDNEIERLISNDENLENSRASILSKSFIRNFTINANNTNKEPKFKIMLLENELTRLKTLINNDVEFLHEIGVSKVKFMIVEKTINNPLFNGNESESSNLDEASINKNAESEVNSNRNKKYLFKSKTQNIVYCISIIGYFNNY